MSDYDGTIEQPFFVWVRGLQGPEPQKWYELDFGINNWKKTVVIAWQPLSDKQLSLPIDDLMQLYPPEKCRYKATDLISRPAHGPDGAIAQIKKRGPTE
jgi:hypothetical protein